MTAPANAPLAIQFMPTLSRPVRGVLLAVIGVALLTISAKIKVPFFPVEMTMQTGVVLLIGAAYGWRLGVATVMAYLAAGAMGMPVFTGSPEKGVGLAYMVGPTGGFLLGFIMVAAIVGWFAERGFDRSFWKMGAVMLVAGALLYLPGLAWLGSVVGWDKPVLQWGLFPFIYGDLFKTALAAAIIALGWRAAGSLRG